MTFMRRRQANFAKSLQAAAMRIGHVEPITAPISVVWAEPPAEQPILHHGEVRCDKCGKALKKHGAHLHIGRCKGK